MLSGLGITTRWCPRSLKKKSESNRLSFMGHTGRTAVTTTSPWSGYRARTGSVPGSAVTCCPPACHSGEKDHRRQPPIATSQAGETQVTEMTDREVGWVIQTMAAYMVGCKILDSGEVMNFDTHPGCGTEAHYTCFICMDSYCHLHADDNCHWTC